MSNVSTRVFGNEIPEGLCANDLMFYPRAHSLKKKKYPDEIQGQIMEQEGRRREQKANNV